MKFPLLINLQLFENYKFSKSKSIPSLSFSYSFKTIEMYVFFFFIKSWQCFKAYVSKLLFFA